MDVDQPDPPLGPEQAAVAALLTVADRQFIDRALLGNASPRWRKVAQVVALTMVELGSEFEALHDVYFAHRVKALVASGALELRGTLASMRYCEVRIPGAS